MACRQRLHLWLCAANKIQDQAASSNEIYHMDASPDEIHNKTTAKDTNEEQEKTTAYPGGKSTNNVEEEAKMIYAEGIS